jgi:hypothetical protein
VPFEHPGHLPNHRGGKPLEPERLPRQRRGTTPQMHGRYPDHDVLALAGHWDAETRDVVLRRLDPPAYRFFDAAQVRTLEAFCDVVTGQDGEPRIPVLRFVDDSLHSGRLPGFRYEGMPDDGEAWRRVASGLDDAAGGSFAELDEDARCELVARFAKHDLHGGVWDSMPIERAWAVVTAAIVTAFYAHPWAWNEIGFGGPAYPRGYMRLGVDQHEPWEGREAEGVGRLFQEDVDSDPEMRP